MLKTVVQNQHFRAEFNGSFFGACNTVRINNNFDIRTTPIYLIFPSGTTSINDFNEMDQSTTYHYKIRAIDNAGNSGIVSNGAFAQTAAKCDLDISFSAELSDAGNSLALYK